MFARSSRRQARPTLLLTALALALLFVLPATASALNYTVDSVGDQPDAAAGGECKTSVNTCTLRAAIQVSNESVGVSDRIEFSAAFNGEAADTISLVSALPDITDQVHIEGSGQSRCVTEDAGMEGPCVGIDADGGSGLAVKAHDVDIDGLAISNASVGVGVFAGGEAFTLFNTWIGRTLKGEDSHVNVGVEVASGAEGVGIGAPEAFRRNIIADTTTGIRTDAPFLEVVGDSILAENAGVEVQGGGAIVTGNLIEGGVHGIRTVGTATAGSLISDNTIEDSGEAAIQLQSPANTVIGNEVVATGAAGIQIDPPGGLTDVSGNLIGGDSSSAENAIFGALGRAIEIVGIEASENEVGRNHGSGNGAEFIGLTPVDPGEGGPNGGVRPPGITTAKKSEASGTAQAGAHVRVFSKASDEAGELDSFLGEVTADGGGSWKVSYDPLPAGTRVTATQTNAAGGTSELSATATTPPDPGTICPLPAACGDGACTTRTPAPPIGCARICPASTIGCGALPHRIFSTRIVKGPKAKSVKTTARFKFTSSIAGLSFDCKLDKSRFTKCRSPKTHKKLKPGKHVFKVRAVDSSGVADPTPATKKFTVLVPG